MFTALSGTLMAEPSTKRAVVRYWIHVPPLEIFPTLFESEFASHRVRTARRRLLNFEMFTEPFVAENHLSDSRDATRR